MPRDQLVLKLFKPYKEEPTKHPPFFYFSFLPSLGFISQVPQPLETMDRTRFQPITPVCVYNTATHADIKSLIEALCVNYADGFKVSYSDEAVPGTPLKPFFYSDEEVTYKELHMVYKVSKRFYVQPHTGAHDD